mmetsp:Transcript_10594/g.29200  ORF Transcript_10594/g.29200 Transcript_10594/m.29200 type:complete len:214 (-) Transcript_10594:2796-3437(-)
MLHLLRTVPAACLPAMPAQHVPQVLQQSERALEQACVPIVSFGVWQEDCRESQDQYGADVCDSCDQDWQGEGTDGTGAEGADAPQRGAPRRGVHDGEGAAVWTGERGVGAHQGQLSAGCLWAHPTGARSRARDRRHRRRVLEGPIGLQAVGSTLSSRGRHCRPVESRCPVRGTVRWLRGRLGRRRLVPVHRIGRPRSVGKQEDQQSPVVRSDL